VKKLLRAFVALGIAASLAGSGCRHAAGTLADTTRAAEDLRRRNRARDLVMLWEAYTAEHPGSAEGFEQLGYARVAWGNLEGARDSFEKFTRLAPRHADGHRMLAFCLAELGRGDSALREADRALELDPHGAAAHEMRASLMAEAARFDEARRHGAAVAGARGALLRARVESLAGEPERALEALRAAEAAARDPETWADIGELYYDLDMLREAQHSYFAATELDLDTRHVNAWLGLFRSLANQKRYDEALLHVDRTLARFPGNPYALLMKAALVGITRSQSEAREILDEAFREHPDDPWVRAQRGWYAFVPTGDLDAALREVELARAESPWAGFEAPTYGWLLQLAGRTAEAARVFEELLARRSRRTLTAHLVEWRQRDFDALHAAVALRLLGRGEDARRLLERQLASPPGAGWARLILRRFTGEPGTSLEAVLGAAEYEFQRCEVHFWEGLRLHFEGDRDAARLAMERCRALGVAHFVEDVFSARYLEGRWPR